MNNEDHLLCNINSFGESFIAFNIFTLSPVKKKIKHNKIQSLYK